MTSRGSRARSHTERVAAEEDALIGFPSKDGRRYTGSLSLGENSSGQEQLGVGEGGKLGGEDQGGGVIVVRAGRVRVVARFRGQQLAG